MKRLTPNVAIRPPHAHEVSAVATLLCRVFSWAYGSAIPAATLTDFLNETFTNQAIAADLGRSDVVYRVAEQHGEIIGVVRLEHGSPLEFPDLTDAIELAKCYIVPEYHGLGVASLLLYDAMSIAQAAGQHYMWLCVWEENPRAVAFYQKHGFRVIGTTNVWIGEVCFIDLLMLREL